MAFFCELEFNSEGQTEFFYLNGKFSFHFVNNEEVIFINYFSHLIQI